MDITQGLSGKDFPQRTDFFGNNYREPIKAKTFCKIFFEALDDFMLKVLIVAATGSLIFEYIGADPDHYSTGKSISLQSAAGELSKFSGAQLACIWHSQPEKQIKSLLWARSHPVAEIYLIIMSSL